MNNIKEKMNYILAMTIYGTIAIFSHYINLSSGLIISIRAIIGSIVVFLFVKLIKKDKTDLLAIKKNILFLILSGLSLGSNWIFLFTSYNYTSVAVATLCNYLAPAIMILISPLVFKEKLTIKKIICVVVALIGMVFVSGVMSDRNGNFTGILLGMGAALSYVGLIVFNKKQKDINVYSKVIIQLLVALSIMLPYALITTDFSAIVIDFKMIILLLIIGIVHTGIAYILYYGPMPYLSSQTIAIFSYFEPVVSIILSIIILKEAMNPFTAIGAILILGATFISEIEFKKQIINNELDKKL